ncbi:MAG: hypothetical protein HOA66_03085 [Candidatus Marinimicrobia bacterium]|nr:hypothetical protein [Candidatus Neomarinimicrobiota bacterium]
MRQLIGIIIILTTSCTEIFKTDLPHIEDCTDDSEFCNYTDSIQPIFNAYCTACHNNSTEPNLSSFENLMISDEENVNLVIPFNYFNSILWQQINLGKMPKNGLKLESHLILMIEKWIDEGANGM